MMDHYSKYLITPVLYTIHPECWLGPQQKSSNPFSRTHLQIDTSFKLWLRQEFGFWYVGINVGMSLMSRSW